MYAIYHLHLLGRSDGDQVLDRKLQRINQNSFMSARKRKRPRALLILPNRECGPGCAVTACLSPNTVLGI